MAAWTLPDSPSPRRTFGPVPRRNTLGRGAAVCRGRLGTGAEERRVYGPPLDGWAFEGGLPLMASHRLGLGWEAGERSLRSPVFDGEGVQF